jgi:hypothetical protein
MCRALGKDVLRIPISGRRSLLLFKKGAPATAKKAKEANKVEGVYPDSDDVMMVMVAGVLASQTLQIGRLTFGFPEKFSELFRSPVLRLRS